MWSSCAVFSQLVKVGVCAKNPNEDKWVPAGAIRQRMNPTLHKEVSPSLPTTLSIRLFLHPSGAPFFIFPPPFILFIYIFTPLGHHNENYLIVFGFNENLKAYS